jgi:hypothetical protein
LSRLDGNIMVLISHSFLTSRLTIYRANIVFVDLLDPRNRVGLGKFGRARFFRDCEGPCTKY